jgi:MFS family permease
VIAAGCIWGFYSAAVAMIFGFGTVLLGERGWSLTSAGSTISLVLWLVGISVPLGGVIADRTRRPGAVMLGGFALFAVAARTEFVVASFAVLGLVSGLSAGPIMSLPARVLKPDARAAEMGLYYAIFYAMVVAGPIVAGLLAAHVGTSRVAFDFGAAMLAACFAAFWVFEQVRPRGQAIVTAAVKSVCGRPFIPTA